MVDLVIRPDLIGIDCCPTTFIHTNVVGLGHVEVHRRNVDGRRGCEFAGATGVFASTDGFLGQAPAMADRGTTCSGATCGLTTLQRSPDREGELPTC